MKNNFNNFLNRIKYELIIIITGSIFAILDIVSKALTEGKSFSVINGFLSVFYTENTGAAWSIFSNHTLGLIIITSLFIIFMIIFNIFFKRKNILYSIAYGMVLSGAICNLLDRILLGYVRDFIKLDFINFPIFNIADSAICIGIVLLCIFFLFFAKNNKEAN